MKIDPKIAISVGWPFIKKLVAILWKAFKKHGDPEESHRAEIEHNIKTVYGSCRQIALDLGGLVMSWRASGFDLAQDTPALAPGCDNADGERTFDEVSEPIKAGIEVIYEHAAALDLKDKGDIPIIAAGVIALGIHELTGEEDVAWLPGDDEKFLYWLIVGIDAGINAKKAAGVVTK